jgi:CO/xanthine dehydrogenase Mo-binding subunit
VIAERQSIAVAGVAALEADFAPPVPTEQSTIDIPMRDDPGVDEALASAAYVVEAAYVLPYITNAPIGPSAAVADVREGEATVYAGTQRPFGLRSEIASALGLNEERVRILPRMPSGTYGRNSVGDAALEAARLSRLARRPILVQWTREEEFALSPTRPAAMLEAKAGVAADGSLVGWRYDEHTNAHGYGGALDVRVAPMTSGRNAIPPYRLGKGRITLHIEPTPVRTASFRSLAAAENVFAIESLVDELAYAAKLDPLSFRLRHIDDPRLRAVIEAVADRSKLGDGGMAGRGKGLAATIYHGTYCAQVAEVEVAANGTPRVTRFWCAIDPGLVVNPDGVKNQVEGGIQQSASWTLLEELGQREGRVTTLGWDTYPIATFRDAPEVIDVQVMGDDGKPSTGVGEPGTVPVAAAIANAIFAASGARVRELPITAERVRAARAKT